MKGRANKTFPANNAYTSPKAGYFILSYSQDKINQRPKTKPDCTKKGRIKELYIQALLSCSPPPILYNKKTAWITKDGKSSITDYTDMQHIHFIRRQKCPAPGSPFWALSAATWAQLDRAGLIPAGWPLLFIPTPVTLSLCSGAAVSGRGRGLCFLAQELSELKVCAASQMRI